MAALINAVVTSCIDSFSSPHPLLLLGLLQDAAAQQESLHLSYMNNVTYLAMVSSTEWMCFVPDRRWHEVTHRSYAAFCHVFCHVFHPESGRIVLMLCWAPTPVGSWVVHPPGSPQVVCILEVTTHLQKCHSLLSKKVCFLKSCRLNSKAPTSFQHRVRHIAGMVPCSSKKLHSRR